jgi:hypothetical protein
MWTSNPKLIMKDKSLNFNYISEGLYLCINHDVFLSIIYLKAPLKVNLT